MRLYTKDDYAALAIQEHIAAGLPAIGSFANRARALGAVLASFQDEVMSSYATFHILYAVGEDLDNVAGRFGVVRLQASKAKGLAIITGSAKTTISAANRIADASGNTYKPVYPGEYTQGSLIEFEAVDAGSSYNSDSGTPLFWVKTPAFTNKELTSSTGFQGGTDLESDDDLRQRLMATISSSSSTSSPGKLRNTFLTIEPRINDMWFYPGVVPGSIYGVIVGDTTDKRYNDIIFQDIKNTLTSVISPNIKLKLSQIDPITVDVVVQYISTTPRFVQIDQTLPCKVIASYDGYVIVDNAKPTTYSTAKVSLNDVAIETTITAESSTSIRLTATAILAANIPVGSFCYPYIDKDDTIVKDYFNNRAPGELNIYEGYRGKLYPPGNQELTNELAYLLNCINVYFIKDNVSYQNLNQDVVEINEEPKCFILGKIAYYARSE